MEDFLYLALTVFISISVSLLGLFVLPTLSKKALEWLRRRRSGSKSEKDMELERATMQISRDWIDISKLLTSIHDDHKSFVNHIQSEMEERNETLCKNIISLEEQFLIDDQRYSKIKRIAETMQEDMVVMKEFLHKLMSTATADVGEDNNNEKRAVIDSYVKTEDETKKRSEKSLAKRGTNNANGASKLVSAVQKCLTNLLKDAELQMSIDREEENRAFQIFLCRFTEDREEIKRTIIQAFAIAADQGKTNFDRSDDIGQDAMHYIAALNGKANMILRTKLEKSYDRLKESLNTLNKQVFDAVTSRDTRENMDGQFADICQIIEIGFQKNTEHFDEIAQNLEKALNNWMGTISHLGEIAKYFTSNTKMMKSMLNEIKNATDYVTQKDAESNRIVSSDNNEIHHDAISNNTAQDLISLSQKLRKLIFMYSTTQASWEKLTSRNSGVEKRCEITFQLLQALAQKLQSLNQTDEALYGVTGDINHQNSTGRIICAKCHDAISEQIESATKSDMSDAIDCQLQMCNNIQTISTNGTSTQKEQNSIGVDKTVKMIEIIFRKVCENRRKYSFKNREVVQEVPGSTFPCAEMQTINEEDETEDSLVNEKVVQDNAEINPQDVARKFTNKF